MQCSVYRTVLFALEKRSLCCSAWVIHGLYGDQLRRRRQPWGEHDHDFYYYSLWVWELGHDHLLFSAEKLSCENYNFTAVQVRFQNQRWGSGNADGNSLCLCLFVSLSVCLSVWFCLSISVSISLCVSVSLFLSVSVSVCLSLSFCLSVPFCLFVSLCISFYLSIIIRMLCPSDTSIQFTPHHSAAKKRIRQPYLFLYQPDFRWYGIAAKSL